MKKFRVTADEVFDGDGLGYCLSCRTEASRRIKAELSTMLKEAQR